MVQKGTYTAEGINAVADALRVSGSITVLILSRNKIEDEGAITIGHALRDNADCKMQTLELKYCRIGAGGAKALAAFCAVSPSLTECKLRSNNLRVEGWTIIFNALRDSPSSKITTWDLYNEGLGPEIAKALAEYISVSGSLTKLVAVCNNMGSEGEAALRKAVEGRAGFELIL